MIQKLDWNCEKKETIRELLDRYWNISWDKRTESSWNVRQHLSDMWKQMPDQHMKRTRTIPVELYGKPYFAMIHFSHSFVFFLCNPHPTFRASTPTFMLRACSSRRLCWPSPSLWPSTAARWWTAAHQRPKWWVDTGDYSRNWQRFSLIIAKYTNPTRQRIECEKPHQIFKVGPTWNFTDNYFWPQKNVSKY